MSLVKFQANGFRSLAPVDIEPHPRFNLISGVNASGKTSLLESIYYLGRGRSFRGTGNRALVQTGEQGFALFGEVSSGDQKHRTGVEVTTNERRIKVNGDSGTSADLARILPVQAIDPEVHQLVQGGPDERRRFLDWGVFHVKHTYLSEWRQYHKVLKQRNAALRAQQAAKQIITWNDSLITHALALQQAREEYLSHFEPLFSSICSDYLEIEAKCSYKQGWPAGQHFSESLDITLDSDISKGFTQNGPHRADLYLEVTDRRARHRVSRGQQKLVAAALIISQLNYLATESDADHVLLVDDPAAELDRDNRFKLFQLLEAVPAQLFITALEVDNLASFATGLKYQLVNGELSSLL